MADLSALKPADTVRTLDVKHPGTGQKIMEIDLLSTTAAKPALVKRRQEVRRTKSRTPFKLDMEEIRGDQLQILSACTVAWRDEAGAPVEWKGAVLECTTANAEMLYAELEWLRELVDAFVNDVAVFLES